MRPQICCVGDKIEDADYKDALKTRSNRWYTPGYTPMSPWAIRQNAKLAPKTLFIQGNHIIIEYHERISKPDSLFSGGTVDGVRFYLETGFRVGTLDNVIQFAFTGLYLPYAWVKIKFDVFCDQSTRISVQTSDVPHNRIYVKGNPYMLNRMTIATLDALVGKGTKFINQKVYVNGPKEPQFVDTGWGAGR